MGVALVHVAPSLADEGLPDGPLDTHVQECPPSAGPGSSGRAPKSGGSLARHGRGEVGHKLDGLPAIYLTRQGQEAGDSGRVYIGVAAVLRDSGLGESGAV